MNFFFKLTRIFVSQIKKEFLSSVRRATGRKFMNWWRSRRRKRKRKEVLLCILSFFYLLGRNYATVADEPSSFV